MKKTSHLKVAFLPDKIRKRELELVEELLPDSASEEERILTMISVVNLGKRIQARMNWEITAIDKCHDPSHHHESEGVH